MQEQDPNLGGFWNETDQGREQGVLNSSSAAAGCAAAGEVEAAEGLPPTWPACLNCSQSRIDGSTLA